MGITATLAQGADEICLGEGASWVCEAVLRRTGSATLARLADLVIAYAGAILAIVLTAVIVSAIARRLVGWLTKRMREPREGGRFGRAVGRTVRKGLFEDRPGAALRRRQRAEALGGLLRGAATFVIWGVAALAVLAVFEIDVGPLLAGAGILGVALGFGAQNLVRDLLSGVFMLLEDQYGVGDVIDVGRTAGVVEGVGLRSTRLRDVNGVLWHVPNGTIEAVGNMSQEWSRALLDVEVAYGTDVDHAKAVILETAVEMWRDDPEWGDRILSEPEMWGVEMLTTNGYTIRVVVQTSPLEQWNVARELRSRLIDAFAREGITVPVEQRVLWLRSGDDLAVPGTPAATTAGHRGGSTRRLERARRVAAGEEAAQPDREMSPEEQATEEATAGGRVPGPGDAPSAQNEGPTDAAGGDPGTTR